MKIESLALSKLKTNSRNDRHGELLDEEAAVAWLLLNRSDHMRNLACDIVNEGQIYEPPLVHKDSSGYTVLDGNRRVTCLKLIQDPAKAPVKEWKEFFKKLTKEWKGTFPGKIDCQVETDRDRIDEILYRRHMGGQSGVGQSQWDAGAKSNFVHRTGKKSQLNVAEEIEKKLKQEGYIEESAKIPRSNLNRLLSAETFRNRVGITRLKKHLEFTHGEDVVLSALSRIVNDMVAKKIVLEDVWANTGKKSYLDTLSVEGVLPRPEDSLPTNKSFKPSSGQKVPISKTKKIQKTVRRTLIRSDIDYGVSPIKETQRAWDIWLELKYRLKFDNHNNAISVLFRVLLELAVRHYADCNSSANIHQNDTLASKIEKAAAHLKANGIIDHDYFEILKKLKKAEELISANTMNKYIHSKKFFPSDIHLKSMWDTLSNFIVICLRAEP